MSWTTPPPGLHYEVVGTGATPVLALHGLGSDHRQPVAFFDDVARARARIFAADLRGHGRTALPETFGVLSIQQLAIDVEIALLERAVSCPLRVVGISMGAAIAVELLARGKLPISSALLIRPAWLWEPRPTNLTPLTRVGDLLMTVGADAGLPLFRSSPDYASVASVSAKSAEALLQQFSAPLARQHAARLVAIPASAPHRPAMTGSIPITVLGADLDPVHPLQLARDLAVDLGATFVEVAARYDDPERHTADVTAAVTAWLEQDGPDTATTTSGFETGGSSGASRLKT